MRLDDDFIIALNAHLNNLSAPYAAIVYYPKDVHGNEGEVVLRTLTDTIPLSGNATKADVAKLLALVKDMRADLKVGTRVIPQAFQDASDRSTAKGDVKDKEALLNEQRITKAMTAPVSKLVDQMNSYKSIMFDSTVAPTERKEAIKEYRFLAGALFEKMNAIQNLGGDSLPGLENNKDNMAKFFQFNVDLADTAERILDNSYDMKASIVTKKNTEDQGALDRAKEAYASKRNAYDSLVQAYKELPAVQAFDKLKEEIREQEAILNDELSLNKYFRAEYTEMLQRAAPNEDGTFSGDPEAIAYVKENADKIREDQEYLASVNAEQRLASLREEYATKKAELKTKLQADPVARKIQKDKKALSEQMQSALTVYNRKKEELERRTAKNKDLLAYDNNADIKAAMDAYEQQLSDITNKQKRMELQGDELAKEYDLLHSALMNSPQSRNQQTKQEYEDKLKNATIELNKLQREFKEKHAPALALRAVLDNAVKSGFDTDKLFSPEDLEALANAKEAEQVIVDKRAALTQLEKTAPEYLDESEFDYQATVDKLNNIWDELGKYSSGRLDFLTDTEKEILAFENLISSQGDEQARLNALRKKIESTLERNHHARLLDKTKTDYNERFANFNNYGELISNETRDQLRKHYTDNAFALDMIDKLPTSQVENLTAEQLNGMTDEDIINVLSDRGAYALRNAGKDSMAYQDVRNKLDELVASKDWVDLLERANGSFDLFNIEGLEEKYNIPELENSGYLDVLNAVTNPAYRYDLDLNIKDDAEFEISDTDTEQTKQAKIQGKKENDAKKELKQRLQDNDDMRLNLSPEDLMRFKSLRDRFSSAQEQNKAEIHDKFRKLAGEAGFKTAAEKYDAFKDFIDTGYIGDPLKKQKLSIDEKYNTDFNKLLTEAKQVGTGYTTNTSRLDHLARELSTHASQLNDKAKAAQLTAIAKRARNLHNMHSDMSSMLTNYDYTKDLYSPFNTDPVLRALAADKAKAAGMPIDQFINQAINDYRANLVEGKIPIERKSSKLVKGQADDIADIAAKTFKRLATNKLSHYIIDHGEAVNELPLEEYYKGLEDNEEIEDYLAKESEAGIVDLNDEQEVRQALVRKMIERMHTAIQGGKSSEELLREGNLWANLPTNTPTSKEVTPAKSVKELLDIYRGHATDLYDMWTTPQAGSTATYSSELLDTLNMLKDEVQNGKTPESRKRAYDILVAEAEKRGMIIDENPASYGISFSDEFKPATFNKTRKAKQEGISEQLEQAKSKGEEISRSEAKRRAKDKTPKEPKEPKELKETTTVTKESGIQDNVLQTAITNNQPVGSKENFTKEVKEADKATKEAVKETKEANKAQEKAVKETKEANKAQEKAVKETDDVFNVGDWMYGLGAKYDEDDTGASFTTDITYGKW